MDEHRLMIFPGDLHDRIDHRGIGGETVEQRLHFHARETEVAQIMLQIFICRLSEVGVHPVKRNDLVRHLPESLQQFGVERGRRRTKNGLFDIVLGHLLFEHGGIEVDVERTAKLPDMGMGVDPFVCFYMHPWEFWPMPKGLIYSGEGAVLPDPFIIKNCGHYAADQFDLLIQKLKDLGSVFSTASGALD